MNSCIRSVYHLLVYNCGSHTHAVIGNNLRMRRNELELINGNACDHLVSLRSRVIEHSHCAACFDSMRVQPNRPTSRESTRNENAPESAYSINPPDKNSKTFQRITHMATPTTTPRQSRCYHRANKSRPLCALLLFAVEISHIKVTNKIGCL